MKVGLGVNVAFGRTGFSRSLSVGVNTGRKVAVPVVVGMATRVVSGRRVTVAMGVAVKLGPLTGRRICVGPNKSASTVRAAAVLNASISGSCVSSEWTSAAVGGLGSKNAIV